MTDADDPTDPTGSNGSTGPTGPSEVIDLTDSTDSADSAGSTESTGRGELETDRGPMPAPARALVVCAHPDDVDFGSAGTVAALTDAGTFVAYCLITSGEAGNDDLTRTTDELREEREREQTAAAKEVGVDRLFFLRHPDGAVEVTLGLRRDIAAVIREVRPELVIAQSPERNLDRIFASHPDHLAAGEATLQAVYPDARNPRSYPELLERGLEPHVVPQVWLAGHPKADLWVDVTKTFPRKVAALRAHASQTAERHDLEEMLRGWLTFNASAGGLEEGRLAEAYKIVTTA